MSIIVPIRRSAYTNPVVVFVAAWIMTLALYILQYSNLLLYDRAEVLVVVLAILLPFAAGAFLASGMRLRPRHNPDTYFVLDEDNLARIIKLLKRIATFWGAVSLVEIAYSGGFPLIWSITGSYKTYFDFGIPTIHGLMNATLLSIVTISTFVGMATRRVKFYFPLVFLVFWGVIVISRNLIIVGFLQCLFVFLFVKGAPRPAQMLALLLLAFLFIIAFGWIGDLRSGAAAFYELAQPSPSYPDFLPSGFLWVYIYITTPLNNLVHQTMTSAPEWNWGLTNSMALLLPSVIRNIFYNSADFFKGDLVTEAFNVSTAFMDMYRDLGYPGMMALSSIIGVISRLVYDKNSIRAMLFSAVLLQCALLSIFFNHYFYLPILFQYPLIALFPFGRQACPEATDDDSNLALA